MANLTLSIPDDLYGRMGRHREYKWSEIARQAFEEKISDAELIADLKAVAKAEQEFKRGKTIPHARLVRELGLENEL